MKRASSKRLDLARTNRDALYLIASLLALYGFIAFAGEIRFLSPRYFSVVLVTAVVAQWATMFLAVLVHEAGHAVAATALGWRVWVFCVGPFVVRFRPQLTIEVAPRIGLDSGGYVLPVPRSLRTASTLRSALISAGGPAASIAAALLGFSLGFALIGDPQRPWSHDFDLAAVFGSVCWLFGLMSLICALVTLWPTTFGNGNDIVHVFRKLRGRWPPSLYFYAANLNLPQWGFGADAWDKHVFSQAHAALRHDPLAPGPRVAAFLEAISNKDFDAAIVVADLPLDAKTPGITCFLSAWAHGCERGDFAQADAMLARCRLVEFAPIWLFQLRELPLIGVLAANGEIEWANQRLAQLRAAIEASAVSKELMTPVLERALLGPLGQVLRGDIASQPSSDGDASLPPKMP